MSAMRHDHEEAPAYAWLHAMLSYVALVASLLGTSCGVMLWASRQMIMVLAVDEHTLGLVKHTGPLLSGDRYHSGADRRHRVLRCAGVRVCVQDAGVVARVCGEDNMIAWIVIVVVVHLAMYAAGVSPRTVWWCIGAACVASVATLGGAWWGSASGETRWLCIHLVWLATFALGTALYARHNGKVAR